MTHNKKLDRYEGLFGTLEDLAAEERLNLQYLEVGTYNGSRTEELCKYWREVFNGTFNYVGFDLFEDMTPETNTAELSKAVLPPSKAEVEAKLKKAGARVTLIKGNTRDTIPAFVESMKDDYKPDLIFIDGGHSLETIASDWGALQFLVHKKTHVLFDDYYENRDDYGCKNLIKELEANEKYIVRLLDPVDTYDHTKLKVRMVSVRLK